MRDIFIKTGEQTIYVNGIKYQPENVMNQKIYEIQQRHLQELIKMEDRHQKSLDVVAACIAYDSDRGKMSKIIETKNTRPPATISQEHFKACCRRWGVVFPIQGD